MKQSGFTLLEIIIVLALISAIASVILPNLTFTVDSQMSVSIKNLSTQIRAAYDNAVFSGRMQRMVIDIRTGDYWVEQAPSKYNGRPPIATTSDKNSLSESVKESYLKNLQEEAKVNSKRPMAFGGDDSGFYSTRSIPVVQMAVLTPIKWTQVSDALISKQSLSGNVVFAKFMSTVNRDPFEYSAVAALGDPKETRLGMIYFMPDGSTTPTSIQLGSKDRSNTIMENGPKFTMNLNTLTGQINLLEGFQDANFKLSKK